MELCKQPFLDKAKYISYFRFVRVALMRALHTFGNFFISYMRYRHLEWISINRCVLSKVIRWNFLFSAAKKPLMKETNKKELCRDSAGIQQTTLSDYCSVIHSIARLLKVS